MLKSIYGIEHVMVKELGSYNPWVGLYTRKTLNTEYNQRKEEEKINIFVSGGHFEWVSKFSTYIELLEKMTIELHRCFNFDSLE